MIPLSFEQFERQSSPDREAGWGRIAIKEFNGFTDFFAIISNHKYNRWSICYGYQKSNFPAISN